MPRILDEERTFTEEQYQHLHQEQQAAVSSGEPGSVITFNTAQRSFMEAERASERQRRAFIQGPPVPAGSRRKEEKVGFNSEPIAIPPPPVKNRVHRVGIELEGGWKTGMGLAVIRDGSVSFTDTEIQSHSIQAAGEIPSPPLEMSEWEGWLTNHYPSYSNTSCGLHIHLSFNSALRYQRLMDPSYSATIVAELERWGREEGLPQNHPMWKRLKGGCKYCQLTFNANSPSLIMGNILHSRVERRE